VQQAYHDLEPRFAMVREIITLRENWDFAARGAGAVVCFCCAVL
jgi:hypothetical protein